MCVSVCVCHEESSHTNHDIHTTHILRALFESKFNYLKFKIHNILKQESADSYYCCFIYVYYL